MKLFSQCLVGRSAGEADWLVVISLILLTVVVADIILYLINPDEKIYLWGAAVSLLLLSITVSAALIRLP